MLFSINARLQYDSKQTVLRNADFSLSDVDCSLTIYTTDVDKLIAAYKPIAIRLTEAKCRPAQTLIGVTRMAFPELMAEIERLQ